MNFSAHTFPLVLILSGPLWTAPVNGAQSIVRPHLIVPASSIGKVQLGQGRAIVHQRMGQPFRSEVRKCSIVNLDSDGYNWRGKDMGQRLVDIWYRPVPSVERKKIRPNGPWNSFEVLYQDGAVVQITIRLSGYKTKDNLDVNSTFQEFAKHYGGAGEASKSWFDLDPDRPAGSSHAMVWYWDFKKYGLTLESELGHESDSPTVISALSIHRPKQSYLFNVVL